MRALKFDSFIKNMYYALAQLAKEKDMNDVAETLIESANQKAVHAGFEVTDELLKKYNPPKVDTAGKKIYVCPVCGYE